MGSCRQVQQRHNPAAAVYDPHLSAAVQDCLSLHVATCNQDSTLITTMNGFVIPTQVVPSQVCFLPVSGGAS